MNFREMAQQEMRDVIENGEFSEALEFCGRAIRGIIHGVDVSKDQSLAIDSLQNVIISLIISSADVPIQAVPNARVTLNGVAHRVRTKYMTGIGSVKFELERRSNEG